MDTGRMDGRTDVKVNLYSVQCCRLHWTDNKNRRKLTLFWWSKWMVRPKSGWWRSPLPQLLSVHACKRPTSVDDRGRQPYLFLADVWSYFPFLPSLPLRPSRVGVVGFTVTGHTSENDISAGSTCANNFWHVQLTGKSFCDYAISISIPFDCEQKSWFRCGIR